MYQADQIFNRRRHSDPISGRRDLKHPDQIDRWLQLSVLGLYFYAVFFDLRLVVIRLDFLALFLPCSALIFALLVFLIAAKSFNDSI